MLIQRRKRSISRRRNHRDNFIQINTLSLLDKLKSNKWQLAATTWAIKHSKKSFVGQSTIRRPYSCLRGAWIAEWSFHSTIEHWNAAPWAMSSHLSDDKLFIGPKHNIYTLFMISIWFFYLILLFVMELWNRQLKINKKFKNLTCVYPPPSPARGFHNFS